MNIRQEMKNFIETQYQESEKILSYYPTVAIDGEKIKAIMINEVVANSVQEDFYSEKEVSLYMSTTLALFQAAGLHVESIDDILALGIYITSAVKLPKDDYTIDTVRIKEHVPILKQELSLFPNVKVIILNGDVAKKALNTISREETKKAVIPAISTYKLRKESFYYGKIRVFPSYIMTGKNILIEKSKFAMVSEDIVNMMDMIAGGE